MLFCFHFTAEWALTFHLSHSCNRFLSPFLSLTVLSHFRTPLFSPHHFSHLMLHLSLSLSFLSCCLCIYLSFLSLSLFFLIKICLYRGILLCGDLNGGPDINVTLLSDQSKFHQPCLNLQCWLFSKRLFCSAANIYTISYLSSDTHLCYSFFFLKFSVSGQRHESWRVTVNVRAGLGLTLQSLSPMLMLIFESRNVMVKWKV